MPIYQQGALNTTALIVPDLYVQIVPPNLLLLNGVPTNVVGVVGAASWGPVNQPTVIGGGDMTQFSYLFGPVMARLYDIGTAVALAVLQGAQAFKIVRVTDGTDTAAQAQVTGTDNTQTVTVGGTAEGGDVLTLAITPSGATAAATVRYPMASTDTLQSGAVGLAAAVNANGVMQTNGISATVGSSGGIVTLHWGGATPTIAPTVAPASLGGTPTTTLTAGTTSTTANVTQITFESIYTGSYGNNGTVILQRGSSKNSWRVICQMPGTVPEVFDNVGVGLAGNALWQAIASAINNGISGIRGPSQLVVAEAGTGAVAPTTSSTLYHLSGGSDGYDGITDETLIGIDSVPRTGMYAMRGQGISVGMLCDVDDVTTFTTQAEMALEEGIYMMCVGPNGDTLTNAATSLQNAGVDTYALKCIFGDYVYWFDTVNNLQRLVSPQGVFAGLLGNLSPQNSSLNKQVYGIIGTQMSMTGLTYSSADLQALVTAGWDVITNPIPAGHMFGPRIGHNASSNAVIHGDNYTRMTNYIAATLNQGMGVFVGQNQSERPNDNTRLSVKATLDAFMQNLLNAGMIDDFQNICDLSNNPPNQIALGYLQASCQVRYLSVVEYFIVNLQGGQSVTITLAPPQPTYTYAAQPTAVNTTQPF